MAIRNPLIQEITNLKQRIRNRQDLGNIVNDQLFGLLNNNPNNNVIIDNNFLAQIGSLNTNINYQNQINTITADIAAIDAQIGQSANGGNPATGLRLQLDSQRARNATAEATGLGVPPQQLAATINSINNDIQRRINDINTQITNLQNQRTPLQTQLTEYQNIQNMYGQILQLRSQEIGNIIALANSYNQAGQVTSQTVGYNQNNANQLVLNNIFRTNNGNCNYAFCDQNTGDPLQIQNNNIQVPLTNGQTVTLSGLSITRANNIDTFNIQNVRINPIAGTTFPVSIRIAIRGRIQDQLTGISLDHYKPFTLTINAPTLAGSNQQNPNGQGTPRATAYDNLNQNNTITNRLTAEYNDANREILENEIIREVLRANGNQAEVDRIYNNEQHRNLLIQRIRSIPNFIPVFNLAGLQAGFRQEMIREDRHVPVQYLVGLLEFTDYIRSNLDESVRTYVRGEIRNGINRNLPPNRNNILREIINFQSDLVNNKLDNNDHMRLDNNLPNNRPQAHPNSRFQRLIRRNSNRNNWTKFFEGRESEGFKDTLETNKGNQEFDIKVAVLGVNKIVTTINIQGEEEPIILDTRDVNDMTHMILRLEATKSGEPINRKLRCRMALNAIKAIVSVSPTTLHREYNGTIQAIDGQNYTVDRLDAFIRGGNLIIRGSCANSHNNQQAQPPQYRQRINHVVFDEERYKGLHNIDELERGMTGLSNQINDIMNAMGGEFRTATEGMRSPHLMRYNTRHYLTGGPVKRLRSRIVHGKTNRDFNFQTQAQAGNKSVNISFERGKFTLAGEFKGEPYQYTSRSLGKLIRKKKSRLRVFDGVELAIFDRINESMIERLRTNTLVGPENFAVSDFNANKTGRVFFLDNHGDLSYIEIEDGNLNPLGNRTSNRINYNDMPPQRTRCNERERREFMQNPLLSGRLIRAMRRRLSLI